MTLSTRCVFELLALGCMYVVASAQMPDISDISSWATSFSSHLAEVSTDGSSGVCAARLLEGRDVKTLTSCMVAPQI